MILDMRPGMTPVQLNAEWCKWLLGLAPWERHYVTFSGRELDWYDDFASGEVDLDTLSGLLARQFEHSIKA